ncbi:hypothetical protein HPP92_019551 [Vanilla planifolia]|uniref:Uncharacterized protein n=1 Tax=Vanilla planifolia TaxID=51239 RepID=A0A835Q916_VANPL|nr:hypothetical protein HPP92_019551 [Vanilla planifolia]
MNIFIQYRSFSLSSFWDILESCLLNYLIPTLHIKEKLGLLFFLIFKFIFYLKMLCFKFYLCNLIVLLSFELKSCILDSNILFNYYLSVVHWKKLTEKQKHIVCVSLYYAVNWIRELLNAFSSQIADKVEITTPNTKHVFIDKLMKRLRNLIVMETILNNLLKAWPLSLPEVCHHLEQSGPLFFQGKKSTQRLLRENIPSNKNKKQKTDPSVLSSSESSGKLRQPTIFDTLKRAGVLMNEGTSGEVSPRHPPHKKTSKSAEHHDIDADELEVMDISIEPKYLDAQRLKFRPLNVESLSLLSVTKCSDTCCADPKAELPLHLYLLRDFRRKLDDLRLLGEQFPTPCIDKVSPSFDKMKNSQLICKVRPIFRSLRKHLDIAVSILKNGSKACHDHWTSQSCSAGNPDLSNLVVSETTVASSVFREVLGCYNRMLCLDEIYHPENLQILRDMLEAFQATEALGGYFSGFQPLPSSGSIDYLYCGVHLFFESILESSFSVSFLLASEVIVTLHSLVNPKTALIGKAQDVMGKSSPISCSYKVLHHLKGRLGLSAHKLLLQDWSSKENDNEWKSKGDILQKILQIYLKNTESASDLLNELACSILPQVPSCKTKNTEEATHGFRTLSPTMFLTWYKVLQEENINVLSNLVKEVKLKNGVFAGEDAGKVLLKIQQAVEVVVSLVSMCKVHDKVAVHAMAVKYGGKFVDLFLKAFDFLQDQFQSHSDLIIKMLKELQKATRIIQALCSDAKGSKRTMVTNKVPSTKRTMERLLFRVKALFHNTATDYTFWMGNLKHKDVYGQVVSSQVYCNEDDYNDPQLEDQL